MPIVAVVLMLVTPRARTNGPAFILGWVAGIAVAGAILLALAASIAVACVVGRYHYVIDVVAGAAVAIVMFLFAVYAAV
jgi:membrane-associated phospholipid phosphatase